ncbi:MAG: DMT family transporter [Alphaproteobacteria bacterium]|nr:DMT family transporter [Alphaproteobacteria bacterium]
MTSGQKTARLALAALLLGAVGIGFAPILVRLSPLGPSATAFYRLLLALPFLVLWLAWESHHRQKPPCRPADLTALALAGGFFAADLAVWHWSVRLTSVANATLFANFAPLYVTLSGWLLFKQHVRPVFVAGMTLALCGAILLMGQHLTLEGTALMGDVLGQLTAVFYAGYIVSVGRLRRHLSTATIMTVSGLVTTPLLLLAALASGEALWPEPGQGWGALIALALVSHVAGQSLIAYALAHLPASFGSVALLLQPLLAALLAWGWLGESLTPLSMAGGGVILVGIYLARRGS